MQIQSEFGLVSEMNDYLSEKIRAVEEYIPNTTEYRIRLDANESPYGLSDDLLNIFSKSVLNIKYNRYPDPYAAELIGNFSKLRGLEPSCVVAGNGSDELISLLCTSLLSKGDKVLTLAPDFSMYEFYSGIIEADVISYRKVNDIEIDFTELKKIVAENNIKLVIFSNPCNPTGMAYKSDIIIDFVRSCNCAVVVDEAYMEFCPDGYSVLNMCGKLDNLIVLKTLSKLGLAALRMGFMISSPVIAAGIRKVKSPYNVNSVSQALAAAALANYGEFQAGIDEIKTNTGLLFNALSDGKAYKTEKPYANFVTLRFDDADKCRYIFESLHEKGISVRYMRKKWLRVTCGTAEENSEFIKEFKALL